MKTLQDYLVESVNTDINESEDVYITPGTACLVQYVFRNGFKETKLTNMIYEPDFKSLDPTGCNIKTPFICNFDKFPVKADWANPEDDIETSNTAIKMISKELDVDIKAGNLFVKNVHGRIWLNCPTAKIVPLNAGEHVKPATAFYYFHGQWNTLRNTDRNIKSFVDNLLKTSVSVFH